jgi:hypothetical protein
MKKPYQIGAQRAVKQLEAMAADGNPGVQMMLPMAEMVGWLRKGVGELIRQAGLQVMELLMQEEVRELVGERSQRQAERTANRWGSEKGYYFLVLSPSINWGGLFHLHGGILLDVLFIVGAIVGDCARCEIDVVADNTGTPRGLKEFWKRAIPSLIGSQCFDECLRVERRYIRGAGRQRRAHGYDTAFVR